MRHLLEQRFKAVSQLAKSVMTSDRAVEISRDPVAGQMDGLWALIRQKTRALQQVQMADGLFWARDRQFMDGIHALWFETEEKLATYYEWRGRKLAASGDHDAALAAWTRRYAVEPEAAAENELLLSFHEKPVSSLLSRFAFRKIGSASHQDLRYPYGIAASAEQRLVYVSDPNLDVLFRFTLDGDFVDTIFLAGGQIFGMSASDGRVWVCDYKKRLLLAVDEAGEVEPCAAFKKILDIYQDVSPFSVAASGGILYVLLVRELDRRECVLVGFSPLGNGRVLRSIELRDIFPGDVAVHDNVAWFVSLQHGFISTAYLPSGELHEFSHVSCGQRGLGIACCRDNLFVCGTGSVSKIDMKGEVVFRRNMYTYGDRVTYVQKGVDAIELGSTQRLYLADNSGTVEIFEV